MSGDLIISTVTVLAILAAWTVVTTMFRVSPLVLPSPSAMSDELRVLLGVGYAGKPLHVHVAASLFRSLTGLVTGIILAVPVGLAMGYNRRVSAALVPSSGSSAPSRPLPSSRS